MARPSMLLLAMRPDVLPLVSAAPTGLRWVTANALGSVKALRGCPVVWSNCYT
jgi:hypothetical protein